MLFMKTKFKSKNMTKFKFFCKIAFFLFAISIFVLLAVTFPYQLFLLSKTDAVLNFDTYNDFMSNKFLSEYNHVVTATNSHDEIDEYTVNYKLFNLFNILSLKVKVAENSVYLGGDCLGFSLKSRGLVVVGSNYIFTKNGAVNPFVLSGLKVGDVINKLNGVEINSIDDIGSILRDTNGAELSIDVTRDGKTLTLSIVPAQDIFSNEYKLGLWIKNNTEGVGTLTFVEDENLRFGSLGHAIYTNSGTVLDVNEGNIYRCKVLGLKKGVDGTPGEILGTFSKTNPIGDVDKNSEYGVFGYVTDQEFLEGKTLVSIGGRATVKPGKATIFCALNGEDIKPYEIEIIKANYQTNSSEKSMVFRVTDKELLALTCGIIQGMSGSPIMQNGKIVGAVTHVFVNDPTKGFGLYLDWMLTQ